MAAVETACTLSGGLPGQSLFIRDDFAHLARALVELKGRFLLSINNCPENRAGLRSFHLEEVAACASMRSVFTGVHPRKA